MTTNDVLGPVKARPFLKWAGGKTQLLQELLKYVPLKAEAYFEPFLGGGALFLHLLQGNRFKEAFINDYNSELINAWDVVRSAPDELIQALKGMVNTPEFFEQTRLQNAADLAPIPRAARMIYLNKTAFNGLYRVNRDGLFNAPYGSYENPRICDEENLRRLAEVLGGIRLTCTSTDFVAACESAKAGDVAYFDPPYLPVSPTANFTSYTSSGFGLRDHERLAALFKQLVERGVFCVASNAGTEIAKALYEGFEIHEVSARRNINSKGDKRGNVTEIIVVGRP